MFKLDVGNFCATFSSILRKDTLVLGSPFVSMISLVVKWNNMILKTFETSIRHLPLGQYLFSKKLVESITVFNVLEGSLWFMKFVTVVLSCQCYNLM